MINLLLAWSLGREETETTLLATEVNTYRGDMLKSVEINALPNKEEKTIAALFISIRFGLHKLTRLIG